MFLVKYASATPVIADGGDTVYVKRLIGVG
jgi:hypothetical protein